MSSTGDSTLNVCSFACPEGLRIECLQLLLATGRARSSNILVIGCQHHLLLMLWCQLTSPASPISLLASNTRSGRGCMPPQGLLLPRTPSYAYITGGLHASGLFQSPTFTCPWVAGACAVCFASGLGLHLPIERGRRLHMACVAHVCPLCPGMHLVMRGSTCPTVLLFRTFAAVIPSSLMTAMSLFMWHPNQKCVASCLLQIIERIDAELYAASHQPCWLQGQSSICLPFPSS